MSSISAQTATFCQSSCKIVLLATLLLTVGACSYVTRVSVTPITGVEPDGDSLDPVLSNNGRYVAFASYANNLMASDDNAYKDIFVRDNQNGTTELISKSISGGSANELSGQPDISADGRYVVFWSFADDLVASDTNLQSDVFIYDRQTDVMERVSVDSSSGEASGGSLGGSVSDDGQRIVFYSTAGLVANDTNNSFDIYVRDRTLGTTELVSSNTSGQAAGSSFDPVIARDGQSIIFWSSASNITSGDNNGYADVFGISTLLPTIINLTGSGNGHSYTGDLGTGFVPSVTFSSSADNLVAGDTNGVSDIFVLESTGLNYLTRRITDGDSGSFNPVIGVSSPLNGTKVAFTSSASNLQEPGAQPLDTNGFTDVYLWERGPAIPASSRTRLMSQTFLGELPNGSSYHKPALSPNGEAVAYSSFATNLQQNDNNGFEDIYARSTFVPKITSVSGNPIVGQTTVLTLAGSFRPGFTEDQVIFSGDGLVDLTVTDAGYSTITLSIEMAAGATPGTRTLIIFHSAPALGISSPLGTADSITVDVTL